MINKLISILVLMTYINLTISHLKILSPKELVHRFDKPIKAAYSNFGNIPYGFSILGKLYYNLDNTEEDYACRPLTGYNISPDLTLDRSPIIMIDRGSCNFVTKTRNVQKINGHLALIVNNEDGPVDKLLLKDDGTSSDIHIPSIMISKADGEKIKESFRENRNNHNILSTIIEQRDKTDLQIFFSSANKSIYRLLKDYAPYHNMIASYVNFEPHYVSHHSPIYGENREVNSEHCLANGKYCSSPRYDLGVTSGKQILLEDLRQKCIYIMNTGNKTNTESDLSDYWDYMSKFYDDCMMLSRFNQDCSYESANEIGLQIEEIEKCITESFNSVNQDPNIIKNKNSLIEEEMELIDEYRVKIFPSVMVNGKTILGSWTAKNIFEAVCSGLKIKPRECDVFKVPLGESNSDLSFSGVLYLIIIILIINIVIIFFCVKYVIKKIDQRVENADVNGRINSVVSSYLSLRDVN